MREPKRRLTIKEWELQTGIKVINPKGFTNWNGKAELKQVNIQKNSLEEA